MHAHSKPAPAAAWMGLKPEMNRECGKTAFSLLQLRKFGADVNAIDQPPGPGVCLVRMGPVAAKPIQ